MFNFKESMREIGDSCYTLAFLIACVPMCIFPSIKGRGVGWGPGITGIAVGGLLTSPITVPLAVVGFVCSTIGGKKTDDKKDEK